MVRRLAALVRSARRHNDFTAGLHAPIKRAFHYGGLMFKGIGPIMYGGREVLPLVEGGKGVSATNHMSSGAWAAAGGIGTVSAVNADSYDPEGRIIPQIYDGLTRRERHEELIQYAVDGAVAQVQRAYELAGGKGATNINVLWEM